MKTAPFLAWAAFFACAAASAQNADLQQKLEQGFKAFDLDKDAALSTAEFNTLCEYSPKLKGKPQVADYLFHTLDANRDSKLSHDEYMNIAAFSGGNQPASTPAKPAEVQGHQPGVALLILDEAWIYLDHPLFAARIREWLKVLRKKNVAVLFATQSLADIAGSPIAPAIIESCPQRIVLPNDRAIEPQSRVIYERFGLNARQVELVATATPKRDYYLQSRHGNRVFQLGLGSIALALCGTSDPASQKLIDAVLEQHGAEGFLRGLLEAKGLDWAASLIDQFRIT